MHGYRLIKLLGRGGMASVHLAFHEGLGREVAIKIVDPTPNVDWKGRFQHEMAVLMRLSHPGVVRFLDGGEHEGRPWYAMELVTGSTIAAHLDQHRALEPREALSILAQVLDALAYLHEAKLVHRDISTTNIMVEPSGRTILMDFGLVRGGNVSLTVTGTILGTPAFMAPEALEGSAGPGADLWSAGVVAFQMLSAQSPFRAETMERTMHNILHNPVPDLSRLAPRLDRPVVDVVMRLLERDPARRWRSARDAHTAVIGLLGTTTVHDVSPTRKATRVVPEGPRTVPLTRPGPRGKARSVALAALAIILTGIVGLVLGRTSNPTPARAATRAGGAPRFEILAPEFLFPRAVRLAARPPVPSGWHMVAEAGDHTRVGSPEGRGESYLFERMSADQECTVTIRSAENVVQGGPLVFRTPVPLRLPGARVVPLVGGVRFTCRRSGTDPLLIEVGHGQPPVWRQVGRLLGQDPLVVHEVSDLLPDADYSLRVTAAGRWGGLAPARFRTLKRTSKSFADDILAALASPRLAAADPLFSDALTAAPPDGRLAAPLTALLRGPAILTDDQVLAIAGFATGVADRDLARGLVERLPTVRWTLARARVVHAAVAAALPGARDLCLGSLTAGPPDELLPGLAALGEVIPVAELARAMRGKEGAPGHGRMLSMASLADRCLAASELFATARVRDERIFGELGILLPRGPAGDAVLDAVAANADTRPRLPTEAGAPGMTPRGRLRRALGASPRPAASRWLGPPDVTDRSVRRWSERLLAGCEDARPWLERSIREAPPGLERSAAVPGLASRRSLEFLIWALHQPDLADGACWALAHAGLVEALPQLRARAGVAADPRGMGLWARARLADREAAGEIMEALGAREGDTPDARLRQGLIAWAAGELGLKEARSRLGNIASSTRATPFTRRCARSSLDWISGGRRPHTYLLLSQQAALATGLQVTAHESYEVWVESLATESAGSGFAGVPLWLESIPAVPVRRLAPADGELVIQRSDGPIEPWASTPPGPLMRVSIGR